MEVLIIVSQSLYFLLPAYVANMMPVVVGRLPLMGWAISENYLGKNKTYRGFVFGMLGAMIVAFIQQNMVLLDESSGWLNLFDYAEIQALIFGGVMGFGALFGDSVKSFFKRRRGIKSGEKWPIFDQLDFVVGALVFVFVYFQLFEVNTEISVAHLFWMFAITPLLHLGMNVFAYWIGLKKVPW